MKICVNKLFATVLSVSLCACSMLGSRQESTKRDIDENSISQLKVLSKKGSKSNGLEEGESGTQTAKDPLTVVSFETRFLHPTQDANQFVKDKKINFNQVMAEKDENGNAENLPPEFDRGALFFGVGGKLAGELDILSSPDDDYKSQTGYVEQASLDRQAELIEKNPACEGHIQEMFFRGVAKFDLNGVNINQIAANTYDSTTKRTLRDDLMEEIEDVLKTRDPSLADKPVDVTQMIFGNLKDTTKDGVTALFKPDTRVLEYSEAKNIIACVPSEGEAMGFILTSKGYALLTSIKVSKEADGRIKVVVEYTTDMTKDDLANTFFRVEKDQTTIPFNKLTFSDKEIPVFETDHKQVSTYTFYYMPDGEAPTATTDQPTDAAAPVEGAPADQPVDANATQLPDETVTTSINPMAPSNSEMAKVEKDLATIVHVPASVTAPAGARVTSPAGNSTVTTTVIPGGENTAPATVARPAPSSESSANILANLTSIYSAQQNWFVNNWFSPVTAGATKVQYQLDSNNDFFYNDLEMRNSKYWEPSYFLQPSKSDAEVAADAAKYDFTYTMNFKTKFAPPYEANNDNYYSLSQVGANGKTYSDKKSYRDVLFDQFLAGVVAPGITTKMAIRRLVEGTLTIPPGVDYQNFSFKVFFKSTTKPEDNFVAYVSSDETRHLNYTIGGKPDMVSLGGGEYKSMDVKNPTVAFVDPNPKPWLKSQNTEAKKSGLRHLFTNYRKPGAPHSDFHVVQKDGKSYGIIHATFRRDHATKLFAYVHKGKLSGAFREGVWESIQKSRIEHVDKDGEKVKVLNRNQIVIFGGFEFSPNQPTGSVKFLPVMELKRRGVMNFDASKIKDSVVITFEGETADLYLRGIPEFNG